MESAFALIQSLGAVLIFAGAWLHLCDRNNEFIGMTLGTGAVLFVIGTLMAGTSMSAGS